MTPSLQNVRKSKTRKTNMRLQFDLFQQGGIANGFYWILSEVAVPENKLICTSVIYDTKDLAMATLNSVKQKAHDAKVIDHTDIAPG